MEEVAKGMLGRGRIIVNTGDGKGKTTAGFGAALRAAGHGLRTAVVQFIKGPWDYGESRALSKVDNIDVRRMGSGFTWLAKDPAEPQALAEQAWALAKELALSDEYDLLILDEINYAIDEGYISVADVVALLDDKPQRLSVMMTGRNAPSELIDVADTVTEMKCVKHAFEQGVPAGRGIEY